MPPARRHRLAAVALVTCVVAACAADPTSTPPISPGSTAAPREVNIIASDYAFVPPAVDLVPGETVLLHVVNGGLTIHEAVIGDDRVQAAWEAAEATTADAPPGPTPVVSVPPDVAGVRIVVTSGQRVDLRWTVPVDAGATPWVVGCHIPGHWARGMSVPVRFVTPTARAPRSPQPR
jgi:uncharacterized cupredoxin-like copper-binding protein